MELQIFEGPIIKSINSLLTFASITKTVFIRLGIGYSIVQENKLSFEYTLTKFFPIFFPNGNKINKSINYFRTHRKPEPWYGEGLPKIFQVIWAKSNQIHILFSSKK